MTTLDFSTKLDTAVGPFAPEEAQLAAMAFLARYSGRPSTAAYPRRVASTASPTWPPWTPASHYAKFKSPPDTPIPGQQRCTTGAARTSTSTPPTPSSPSWLADKPLVPKPLQGACYCKRLSAALSGVSAPVCRRGIGTGCTVRPARAPGGPRPEPSGVLSAPPRLDGGLTRPEPSIVCGRVAKEESPSPWCRSIVVARPLLAPRRSEPTGITDYERLTVGARWAGPEQSSCWSTQSRMMQETGSGWASGSAHTLLGWVPWR